MSLTKQAAKQAGGRTTNKRNSLIAKIHIAKKQMGLDESTYRDMLWRITGKRSCKQMSIKELNSVLRDCERLGFKPIKQHGRKPNVASHRKAILGKIEAILTDLGLPWQYAENMAKTMFGGHGVIEWLSDEKLYKLTQALAVYQARKKRQANKTPAPD